MIEISCKITRNEGNGLVQMELNITKHGQVGFGEAAFAKDIIALLSEGPQRPEVRKLGEWHMNNGENQ